MKKKTRETSDLVSRICSYEGGELTPDQEIDLFCELVRNGMAWTLQGHYGRVATAFIENGYIRRDGVKLKDSNDEPVADVPPEKPRSEVKIPKLTPKEVLANPPYNTGRPSLRPFEYVESRNVFAGHAPGKPEKPGKLALIAFGAYNAMGLIGPEKGGVALVMEAPKRAVMATKTIAYSMQKRSAETARLCKLANDSLETNKAAALLHAVQAEEGWEWR